MWRGRRILGAVAVVILLAVAGWALYDDASPTHIAGTSDTTQVTSGKVASKSDDPKEISVPSEGEKIAALPSDTARSAPEGSGTTDSDRATESSAASNGDASSDNDPSRSTFGKSVHEAPERPEGAIAGDARPDQPAATEEPKGPAQPRLAIEKSPEAPEDPDAPRFELVRMDPDGQTVIAGRAPPFAEVEILLDEKVVDRAKAGSDGAFVSIIEARVDEDARRLQLRIAAPELARAPAPDQPEHAASTNPQPTVDRSKDPDPSTAVERPSLTGDEIAPARTPGIEIASAISPRGEVTGEADPVSGTGREPPASVTAPQSSTSMAVISGASATANVTPPPSAPEAPSVAEVDQGVPAMPARVEKSAYRTSAPVIVLPGHSAEDAPTLLKSTPGDLEVVQPSVADVNAVVLDRVSYGDIGDVRLTGRGRPGRAVRLYGNADPLATTKVGEDGTWEISIEPDTGREIKLLRVDEIDRAGKVQSRIEAPFTYSRFEPKVLREREVTIQRGDMLWRIAEQHYGEGLRYSLIYGANDELIRDPDLIYPGQIFTIPELVDAE